MRISDWSSDVCSSDLAHMVALNRHTGKVIWNKQIADYQAGYSATTAPMVVKGKVIYGNSGGEFGIVGAVEARDVNTGELVWRRPTIEGHMGTLKIGRASCRERVCQYVSISVVAVS